MDSTINTALSGLSASATRMYASANNIANMHSTATSAGENKPYVPQQVVQQSQQAGGVRTTLQDITPPSVTVFAPDHPSAGEDGTVKFPNINLESEVINQVQANNTYKANLNVIKRANETYESLLDITS